MVCGIHYEVQLDRCRFLPLERMTSIYLLFLPRQRLESAGAVLTHQAGLSATVCGLTPCGGECLVGSHIGRDGATSSRHISHCHVQRQGSLLVTMEAFIAPTWSGLTLLEAQKAQPY